MGVVDQVLAELVEIPKGKGVEEYLKDISYRVTPGYVPTDFALGFVAFIKLVNGEEGEENMTPLVHFYMLDTLVSGATNIANLCSRGLAKTTLFGEYFILYISVYGYLPNFGKVSLMLYVSDSIENGVKNMRKNLEYRYESSDFLQRYVPKIRFTDIRWEFKNLDGKVLIVKGYGSQTGVRGAKELGTRPQIAILDDLISDEDARSPTVIASIEDTVYKALNYALHPDKSMKIWSGTPFNASDPLYKAVESGAWTTNVYPVCEHFPCSREDFISAWPDRFTYDYVLGKYNEAMALNRIDTFNAELMLRIMSDEDRMIKNSQILWYSLSALKRNKEQFNFYITTDFATSEKQHSDFSVISVWAYNAKGDWFYVDGICKRQTMDKNIDALFHLVQEWNPLSVGIEVSGQQNGFISWIRSVMMDRSIYFTLASDKASGDPGIRPSTDKMKRFSVVQPLFAAYKMFFPVELKESEALLEGMNELQLISKGGFKAKRDDFLDTVSMLGLMEPWKPTERSEMTHDSARNYWEHDVDNSPSSYLDSYVV